MAEYTNYANYVIYFRDQTDYDNAVLIAGGINLLKGPAAAAAMFGITYPPVAGPLDPVKGIYTLSYTFATPGANIGHPLPSGVTLDDTVDSVLVPGQAGSYGGGVGPDLRLKWCANIVRAGGTSGASPAPAANIPLRRWVDGFEFPTSLEGGSGATTTYSRDASRTVEGVGYALRDVLSQFKTHNLNENQAGLVSRKSWERFYVRLRTAMPTAEVFMWQSIGSSTSSNRGRVTIDNTGRIKTYNVNLGVATLLGTHATPLTLEQRYRIDILVYYNSTSGLGQGTLRVYLDGTLILSHTIAQASGGLGSAGDNHAGSELGNNNGAANVFEIDYDDWRNSDVPETSLGVESLTSIDWLTGHHSQAYYNGSINASTNWAEPVLASTNGCNATGAFNTVATARARSTTALSRLNVRSEYSDQPDQTSIRIGACASLFIQWATNSLSSAAQLGYALSGGAAVMSNVSQFNSPLASRASYRPTGMNTPTAITSLDVIKDHSNDGATEDVFGLRAVVESIGTWSRQDDSTAPNVIPIIHNAYYPNTLYAFYGPAPDAPVFAAGGTYTGTNATQNVNLPGPAHFIWIRPLTGGTGGVKWFGSGLGGNPGDNDGIFSGYITRAFVDSAGQAKFQVGTQDSQVNQTGVTYQWIAFCDPGMRYNLCGAFRHSNDPARASVANTLIDTGFTPIACFAQIQTPNANSANGLRYKGPGMTGNNGCTMGGGALTNFGSFAAGVLTSRADIHDQTGNYAQTAYSLWRNVDGSGSVMVQILSYTGDGNPTKTITLTPTSGRFPLLAMVMNRAGSVGIMRDPSHAGTNSCNIGNLGNNAATGITAGAIDQITVGSALNNLGTVYDVFVIPGDTAGWNNGTFYPPSVGSPSSVYPAVSGTPPDIGVIGEGGLELSGAASTFLVENLSGIYEIVPGKRNDTIQTRAGVGTGEEDVEIPDPFAETGYIGG